MDVKDRDLLIAKLLNQGLSLSEVQKTLETEHQVRITYGELRLIAAGLQVNWKKLDVTKAAAVAAAAAAKPAALDALQKPRGATTEINLSKIQRPGAVLSGDATFKSGAKAEWWVDQMGRLGLAPKAGSAKPTEDDLQDFQLKLQEKIEGQA